MRRTLNEQHRTILEWINGTKCIEYKAVNNTSDSNASQFKKKNGTTNVEEINSKT